MAKRKSVNERGRKPGDPSVELLQLIGQLQHTAPDDRDLTCIGPKLYAEALELIDKMGRHDECIVMWNDVLHTRFCGHLISPEHPSERMAS